MLGNKNRAPHKLVLSADRGTPGTPPCGVGSVVERVVCSKSAGHNMLYTIVIAKTVEGVPLCYNIETDIIRDDCSLGKQLWV